eukprot:359290-Chlamydomonas_euryale.AAC.5
MRCQHPFATPSKWAHATQAVPYPTFTQSGQSGGGGGDGPYRATLLAREGCMLHGGNLPFLFPVTASLAAYDGNPPDLGMEAGKLADLVAGCCCCNVIIISITGSSDPCMRVAAQRKPAPERETRANSPCPGVLALSRRSSHHGPRLRLGPTPSGAPEGAAWAPGRPLTDEETANQPEAA